MVKICSRKVVIYMFKVDIKTDYIQVLMIRELNERVKKLSDGDK